MNRKRYCYHSLEQAEARGILHSSPLSMLTFVSARSPATNLYTSEGSAQSASASYGGRRQRKRRPLKNRSTCEESHARRCDGSDISRLKQREDSFLEQTVFAPALPPRNCELCPKLRGCDRLCEAHRPCTAEASVNNHAAQDQRRKESGFEYLHSIVYLFRYCGQSITTFF